MHCSPISIRDSWRSHEGCERRHSRKRDAFGRLKFMFISKKQHEKQLEALQSAGNRMLEVILNHVSQGVFVLDARDRILPPVSRAMATLFRRRDFADLSFERLLCPIVDAQTLADIGAALAKMRHAGTSAECAAMPAMREVEVYLPRADGGVDVARYAFDFFPLDIPGQPQSWLARVTDRTLLKRQSEELEDLRPQLADAHPEILDLRAQLALQKDVLQSVMRVGSSQFAAAVQRSGSAMQAVNEILKQPAREQEVFRQKLEAICAEVAEIRRAAESLHLSAMEAAARSFEESLQDLRVRDSLSGNDFLPLAVLLDALFGQYRQLRSLTRTVVKPPAQPTMPSAAPAGSLEATLRALTALVADEYSRPVVLSCIGLHRVPAAYQATVKNIAIQLIRNAVIHGIEPAEERERLGKQPEGGLSLQFNALPDGTFELRFRDDGRGLDPAQVRRIAVERELITGEAAARLRDRQAIKLIFQERYSTLAPSDAAATNGAGLAFVRRYVHDVHGKIALASEAGKETRFKVSLPPLDREVESMRAEVA